MKLYEKYMEYQGFEWFYRKTYSKNKKTLLSQFDPSYAF